MSIRLHAGSRRIDPGAGRRAGARGWIETWGGRVRDLALDGLRCAGAAILDADCPCCRQPMGWGRYGVCDACWDEVTPAPGAGCDICDHPLPATEVARPGGGTASWRCGTCAGAEPPFSRIAAYGRYAGRLRDLIHALKYDGRERLARPLGELLAEALLAAGLRDRVLDSVIVPVPLAPSRQAERGYNQSHLLAWRLRRSLRGRSRRAAWPEAAEEQGSRDGKQLERRCEGPRVAAALKKIVETLPQAGRTRAARLKGPLGAYAPARGASGTLAGRGVVLVDDVFTTGATAGECARVLRAAGAADVIVAVIARTAAGEGPAAGGKGRHDDDV